MTLELVALGIVVGILSGFFGVGGGTITVPLLLYMGLDIKEAIGISVMQMLAGSIMGALIHRQKKSYDIAQIKYFGFGGFAGAVVGGYLVMLSHSHLLEWLFLSLVLFTLVRVMMSSPAPAKLEIINRPLYVSIGGGIGVLSGMLGVGGSILMTPILVSFMGFELKKASAIGLFFVMFTSSASVLTLGTLGMIDWKSGVIVALSSLAGIWIGIGMMQKIHLGHFKQTLVVFYIFIFCATTYKLLLN
jgi:uncharacterized membrane protein YfcA